MKQFAIDLPIPPSTNQLFENNKPGSRHPRRKSIRYQSWLLEASLVLNKYKLPHYKKTKTEPRRVWTHHSNLILPKNKFYRCDLDNYFKAPIDLIAKKLNLDDRYLIYEQREKVYSNGSIPSLKMMVTVYEDRREYEAKTRYEEGKTGIHDESQYWC